MDISQYCRECEGREARIARLLDGERKARGLYYASLLPGIVLDPSAGNHVILSSDEFARTNARVCDKSRETFVRHRSTAAHTTVCVYYP